MILIKYLNSRKAWKDVVIMNFTQTYTFQFNAEEDFNRFVANTFLLHASKGLDVVSYMDKTNLSVKLVENVKGELNDLDIETLDAVQTLIHINGKFLTLPANIK